MENFEFYSNYYDLFNSDKNYELEIKYILGLIETHLGFEDLNILELGSGSGGHAQFLSGYNNVKSILGVERSSLMVNIANSKKISKFTSIVGDISNLFEIKFDEKFNVVLSLFHVVSYLESNSSLQACFKGVQDKLQTGGLFIFDVWYSPSVYHQKPETRVRRKENSEIMATRIAESKMFSDLNVVDVNYEIIVTDKITKQTTMFEETHRMRHFSTPEMGLIASSSGFEVIDAHEFLTHKKPSEDTWGVTYILIKK